MSGSHLLYPLVQEQGNTKNTSGVPNTGTPYCYVRSENRTIRTPALWSVSPFFGHMYLQRPIESNCKIFKYLFAESRDVDVTDKRIF